VMATIVGLALSPLGLPRFSTIYRDRAVIFSRARQCPGSPTIAIFSIGDDHEAGELYCLWAKFPI
jgi:hypothetical protein